MKQRLHAKRFSVSLLLLTVVFLLGACTAETIMMTPVEYLEAVNELVTEDYGALTVNESLNTYTTVTRISDRLFLTMEADPVTGYLQRAELALYFDADIESLDYSSFSYFFLIMLKAYDPDITITNINSIHDALDIENYTVGTDHSIGYGSSNYFYTVSDETALFSAQFLSVGETAENNAG